MRQALVNSELLVSVGRVVLIGASRQDKRDG